MIMSEECLGPRLQEIEYMEQQVKDPTPQAVSSSRIFKVCIDLIDNVAQIFV